MTSTPQRSADTPPFPSGGVSSFQLAFWMCTDVMDVLYGMHADGVPLRDVVTAWSLLDWQRDAAGE